MAFVFGTVAVATAMWVFFTVFTATTTRVYSSQVAKYVME
jgi:hypothetical protein